MARTDTGLGWSANSDWMTNTPILIGSISTFVEPYPLPHIAAGSAPSAATVVSAGASIVLGGHTYYILIQTNTVNGNVGIGIRNTNPGGGDNRAYIAAISWEDNCSVGQYWVNICDGTVNRRYGSFAGRPLVTQASGGMYYAELTSLDNYSALANLTAYDGTILAGGPSYDDLEQRYNSGTTDFYKENPGYAVACFAKWKTSNDVQITTPVLISSVSEYTDMTTTGSGYNLAKLNILHSGMRFYMSFWDVTGNPNITTLFPVFDYSDPSRPALTLEDVFKFIASVDYAAIAVSSAPDPYQTEGGDSGEEGGEGEDVGDDDAGIEAGSDFPSAINTGFCRIYSPSESELRNLSNYLWSNSYDLAQVKKLFSNPMDSILGLSAVPIRLLGSSVSFSLGGVPITGMTLPLVQQQRYTYHMGSITIKERWGSYLDYDPYTKFSIFLPFIGMRELAADDIMGKTVGLVYDIDILTGMCVARLQAGTNCLYEWGGNCAIQLPINSRNWDSVFSTAVSAVGGIVSAVTGGSAPLVAGSVASAALQTVSMKPRIDKSSTIGGAAGWLGQMTPYIIRTTPEAFIPADQNKFIGYPAYINVSLDEISGYNEVESIHLENVTATGAELEEIESILKGGVIF